MRTWARVSLDRVKCGGCGEWILHGAPIRVLQLPGVQRLQRRCPACAGETAPPDLPALPPPVSYEPQPRRLTSTGEFVTVLPFDWKRRASGDGS